MAWAVGAKHVTGYCHYCKTFMDLKADMATLGRALSKEHKVPETDLRLWRDGDSVRDRLSATDKDWVEKAFRANQ